MRFAHTNIITRDWRRLADFYTACFDCEVVPPLRDQTGDWLDRGTGLQGARLQGAHLRLPGHGSTGPTLEIYQYDTVVPSDPAEPNRVGLGHLAFEVADVESCVERVLALGGSLQGSVTQRTIPGAGELVFVYARDPDGNLLELQSWR